MTLSTTPDPFVEATSETGRCWVHRDWRSAFESRNLRTFSDWMALTGIEYREVSMRPERPVVSIEIPGKMKRIYLKRNLAAPRPEGPTQKLRLAQVKSEGRKEVEKILGFWDAGIPTQNVVAWGEGEWEGIANASFVATEDLESLPMERYLFRYWTPPLTSEGIEDKKHLIEQLADLTHRMHQRGWVHRDFYLGHVFVREGGESSQRISVIDVQRATRRPSWWLRSQIKDLASLHFSADPAYIDDTDRTLFMKTYWKTGCFSAFQKFQLRWIRAKSERIRRHTEKALGIPYRDYFKNKYY